MNKTENEFKGVSNRDLVRAVFCKGNWERSDRDS